MSSWGEAVALVALGFSTLALLSVGVLAGYVGGREAPRPYPDAHDEDADESLDDDSKPRIGFRVR